MKSKKSKLATSSVASPMPTGRKDCGGRRDRQTLVDRWQGCSPIPMGRKDHGGNDPPQSTRRFWHPGTIRRCCSRPLLRRGRRAARIKGRIALVFETPRGRYGPVRQAFPGHTGPPNAVKETGRVQAKQSKHVKAKNEGKIIQAEFYNSMARKLSCKTQSCDESSNSSKNYKLVREGQKNKCKV